MVEVLLELMEIETNLHMAILQMEGKDHKWIKITTCDKETQAWVEVIRCLIIMAVVVASSSLKHIKYMLVILIKLLAINIFSNFSEVLTTLFVRQKLLLIL